MGHLKGVTPASLPQRRVHQEERSVFAVSVPQPSGEYPARPTASPAPATLTMPAVAPPQPQAAKGAFQATPAPNKRRFSGASGAVPGQVGQGEGTSPPPKPRVSDKAKARAQETPTPLNLDNLDDGWTEVGESPTLRLPAIQGPGEENK